LMKNEPPSHYLKNRFNDEYNSEGYVNDVEDLVEPKLWISVTVVIHWQG
jgi:hypothetical protein